MAEKQASKKDAPKKDAAKKDSAAAPKQAKKEARVEGRRAQVQIEQGPQAPAGPARLQVHYRENDRARAGEEVRLQVGDAGAAPARRSR